MDYLLIHRIYSYTIPPSYTFNRSWISGIAGPFLAARLIHEKPKTFDIYLHFSREGFMTPPSVSGAKSRNSLLANGFYAKW